MYKIINIKEQKCSRRRHGVQETSFPPNLNCEFKMQTIPMRVQGLLHVLMLFTNHIYLRTYCLRWAFYPKPQNKHFSPKSQKID